MKTKLVRILTACLLMASVVSCTTAYDAYGRPVSVVDPGAAALGIAAAGVAGYAIGRNNSDHHHHHRHYDRYASYNGYRPHYSNYYY